MMKMINLNTISSWIDHLQEDENGMGYGFGCLGGRWIVTLYSLYC